MSDAGATIGAVFIGSLVQLYLTAVTNGQGIHYLGSTLDSDKLKIVTALILVASSVRTGIVCYELYEDLVVHFGDFAHLTTATWGLVAHAAIFTAIAFVVQLYYAHKISTLYTGVIQSVLVTTISLLALAQLAFGILATYNTVLLSTARDIFALTLGDRVSFWVLAALVGSILCNIIICTAMMIDMRTSRFTVRSETFSGVISRLVAETNLLTTVCVVLNLVFFFVFRENDVSLAFALVIPQLYLLSMFKNIGRHEAIDSPLGIGSSSSGKRESSLSDMFKGKPFFRGSHLSRSVIGVSLAPNFTFDPPPPVPLTTWETTGGLEPPKKNEAFNSISDYGGYSTSIFAGSPKVFSEGQFSRQRDSPSPGSGPVSEHMVELGDRRLSKLVGFAVTSEDDGSFVARTKGKGKVDYGYI